MERFLHPDQRDIICAFVKWNVRFLVVGGYAFSAHAFIRATQDIDLWIAPEPSNAARAWAALAEFGAGLHLHGVTQSDFVSTGLIYQLGSPPGRVDVMTDIGAVSFDEAWAQRVTAVLDGIEVGVLGLAHLIQAKEAADRPQDRVDLLTLRKLSNGEHK